MARTPAPAPSGDELLKVLAALGNPHRLRIVAALHEGRNYVSRLAREIGMSRPLLHMHLQRLEAAGLITGSLELSEDGKAMKFYEVVSFRYELTPELIEEVARTLGDGDGEPEGEPPGKDKAGTGKPETVKEEAT
ncbi:winged helix-turn-helix domain-containing protein [Streptomyces sp. NBC_01808]|uniref:ArsR/SmtB family transcription factor n=1 Tax=Streptomyces sp. NBC_01808 TaxID=2975947 RepID=UPI002DDA1B39|nr:winged helix-turn-helix domain-containing protein [Streptomyces sp. NBC_01808]WSA39371.1 winged helix-turn-helix domain-containing protein [Streptomyces sp. NBC_01808]